MAAESNLPRVPVRVRYFAALREALGPEERIEVAAGSTVGEVQTLLRSRSTRHAELLASGRPLRVALDHALLPAPDTFRIEHGCELAFFPPVTGG